MAFQYLLKIRYLQVISTIRLENSTFIWWNDWLCSNGRKNIAVFTFEYASEGIRKC